MQKLSADERDKIKEDFLREKFWVENVVWELDCWFAFYFQHGRFPCSQKLISIPQVKLPFFLKADMPISPVDLYKKITGIDAKALVSIHALAALNIYFGGKKILISSSTWQIFTKFNLSSFKSRKW